MPDDIYEVRLGALVSRRQESALPPPLAVPSVLPFGELSPPVFERLVGEVMWLVDGMNDVRGYGRSGQDQGGLDLVGRRGGCTHVYQVRRIESLSPRTLRDAVTDFAGPSRVSTPKSEWSNRHFAADRFVLATGCSVNDTHVENELVSLQERYQGDLIIDLYDAGALTRFLRDRPSVVGGIFGPEWAKALFGMDVPANPPLPDAYALLNDPLEHLGLSGALHRAQQLAETDPGPASELLGDLVRELRKASYVAHAEPLQVRMRELLAESGAVQEAFRVSAGMILDRYDSGQDALTELRAAANLANQAGSWASSAHVVLTALEDWYGQGYDLAPVVEALRDVVDSGEGLAPRVALAVAEQMVVEDDPRDDPADLAVLLNDLVDAQSGEMRVRMECCLADFAVRGGKDPREAFGDLERRALSGYLAEEFASLVLMRQGRALALADLGDAAAEAYRRAVLFATRSGLGGDARHALRSISFLAHQYGFGSSGFAISSRALLGARTLGSRQNCRFQSSHDPAVSALEGLVDDKPRSALRWARRWLWEDRISGALTDELGARNRLADIFVRCGMPRQAVEHLILAGQKKLATKAADDATEFLDVRRFLPVKARWVHYALGGVLKVQADFIPDSAVEEVAGRLAEIVIAGPVPGSSSSDSVKSALGALAALASRLPETPANRVFDVVWSWLPREPNHYRFTDKEMLAYFSACVDAGLPTADRAREGLLEAWERHVASADGHLSGLEAPGETLVEAVRKQAASGRQDAVHVLVNWQVNDPTVNRTARVMTQSVLDEPVGVQRNEYSIGHQRELAAALLMASHDIPSLIGPEEEPVDRVRVKLAAQLMTMAEEKLDTADRRSSALQALIRLASALPEAMRNSMFDRVLALHNAPGEHPMDALERRSQHPLSGLQINLGAHQFPAVALLAAAVLSHTAQQAGTVQQRLLPRLAAGQADNGTSYLHAQTLMSVDPLHAVPVALLASHPSHLIRQVAVLCWHRHPDRDPALATVFTHDKNPGVRHNIAHALAQLIPDTDGRYERLIEQLRYDPSARVRHALANANSHPTSGSFQGPT
ncbi:HEAT repeat domain-containing protein [Streptomyces sp. LX-29]|uniref:HEAT repeat domain-containing protein n=1 Tax=Streptomyces sp. LX-29 TaxID=2900152 RepID=UPI00240D0552|nr:HEAT repeat domain-containing protein [Streptomyces sp. LX-29]WFB11386.1 HEAT repeat domain-containing protein [Streptomyces sp. LX-29]